MPPKDVKSAKKLYAKMKKEQQKAAGSREETPEVSKPEEPSSEPTEPTESAETTEPKEEPKEEPKSEPKEEPTSEPKEELKEEPKKEPKEEPNAEPGSKAELDQTPSEPAGNASVKPKTAEAPEDSSEEAAPKTPSDNAVDSGLSEQVGEVPETTSENPEGDATSASVPAGSEKESEISEHKSVAEKANPVKEPAEPGEPAPKAATKAATKAAPKASGEHSETIATLRQENDDLKLYVKKLESTIQRLEGELSLSRRNELSLSPQLQAHEDLQIDRSRNRTSSFVEADLYSEAEKVSARQQQMERWKGYQLDLRPWTTRTSFGPIVTI